MDFDAWRALNEPAGVATKSLRPEAGHAREAAQLSNVWNGPLLPLGLQQAKGRKSP
jgi:hypothetical protein